MLSNCYFNHGVILYFQLFLQGNTSKVNELWNMLTSAGLKPSINMFSSSLESAARSHRNKHTIAEIIKAMKDTVSLIVQSS